MAVAVAGGFRRKLLTLQTRAGARLQLASRVVIDTARGSRRIARENRQAQASGSPRNRGIFDPKLLRGALGPAVRKMDPRSLARNPVMFVVEVTAALVTLILVTDSAGLTRGAAGEVGRSTGFELQIAIWLWFTVYFATYAEALAEARGKAQAATLRKTRSETIAHRRCEDGTFEDVGSSALRCGDVIVVREGETIPGDGDVIEGVAYVNEAVITGESAPVLKEPGTDIRSSVTGGTTITSDQLTISITANPGETFLDRMIALVEGAKRQRTPNEIALSILLSGLTIVFLMATATLRPFGLYAGAPLGIVVLVALLVCLIPTTIGGLLSAIGIAGMDRVARFNVLAMSGRAVEAAGDVDVILLDKTGTITFGNRLASRVVALPGVPERDALEAALLTSLEDETPEGRSVVELAKSRLAEIAAAAGGRTETAPTTAPNPGAKAAPDPAEATPEPPEIATVVPFSAESRTSGVILADGTVLLKGAVDAIVAALDAVPPAELQTLSEEISSLGATPLAIRRNGTPLGVIELKDTVKPGLRARFDELRRMGIRTVMVTGDNPLTAQTIAGEAGVDDFMAQAKPEDKIARIRAEQADGHLVAMTGDGTNDAPAVAQADVGLAMNSGTSACKEAANMVDLDSDPTKLIEVIAIGKQLLITRGAITTFSIANDVAKYFAILPAMFAVAYPELNQLNVMALSTPQSAILSAVIFNALIIIALVPLSMRGVAYRAAPAADLLRRNLLIYGVGGIFAPFLGIKAIDLLITAIHLA
jgi:potassium-transporting ATPase ATP-binding subunit